MIRLIDLYDDTGEPRKHAEQFLYELMIERQGDPEINISHKALPTMPAHQAFVRGRPYRYWYLIDYLEPGGRGDRLWVGYVSATNNNEIGIVLQRAWRGKGLGPMAVRMFLANHKPQAALASQRADRWLANVAPANERSQAMFNKLGFTVIQHTYALPNQFEEEHHGNKSTHG